MNVDLTPKVVEKVYDDLISSSSKSSGQIIDLVPRAVRAALLPVEKWILQKEYNLMETKILLNEKLKNIPPENIVPPEPYVAIPALDAISYTINCEDLREMYSNILAQAMNSETKEFVHPAFIQIISQLSPFDAKLINETTILKEIATASCRVRIQDKSNAINPNIGKKNVIDSNTVFRYQSKGRHLISHLLTPKYAHNAENISLSITNLERLGLVTTAYPQISSCEYADFPNHPSFLEYVMDFQQACKSKNDKEYLDREIALIPGIVLRTDFGENFYKICLKE